MKTDTQHLDYLLSQYVDGCLDGPNRKSLEQRLVIDPATRALYQEHRDVQDVLDDWGNRIPLINWDEFDQQLARRLGNETVGGQTISIFRRWVRPLSIAAGLAIAASLGYGWHAWSMGSGQNNVPVVVNPASPPSQAFAVEDAFSPGQGSIAKVRVDETPDVKSTAVASNEVNVTAPGNVEAADSLRESVSMGLPSVRQTVQGASGDASSAHVAVSFPPVKKDEKDGPAFP